MLPVPPNTRGDGKEKWVIVQPATDNIETDVKQPDEEGEALWDLQWLLCVHATGTQMSFHIVLQWLSY